MYRRGTMWLVLISATLAHAQAPDARYELVRAEPRQGNVEVFDRATGRLFVLEGRLARCVDTAAGTLIERPVTHTRAERSASTPEWPAHEDGVAGRFLELGTNPNPTTFDTHTGRLYVIVLEGPTREQLVFDAPAARVTETPLAVRQPERPQPRPRPPATSEGPSPRELARRERRVVVFMKNLTSAQENFHRNDLEQDGVNDYGTFDELVAAGVLELDPELGYALEIHLSETNPRFMWMAVARPLEPGVTGTRYYAINHVGSLVASLDPERLTINPDCEITYDDVEFPR